MHDLDLTDWPVVPESERPKPLPHEGLHEEVLESLRKAGWLPIDIRLLPSETMAQRTTAVLHWFEAARLGTIPPDPKKARIIEMEARACGLHIGKGAPTERKKLEDAGLEELLGIGGTPEWQTKINPSGSSE